MGTMKINYTNNKKKLISLMAFIIFMTYNVKKKIKVGIVGLKHSQNCGNNLLKYSIYIKIRELGFDPYIIGMRFKNDNIINSAVRPLKVFLKKVFKRFTYNEMNIKYYY